MSALSDAKTKIAKLLVNMDRFDLITNGNADTDVALDSGTVPTIRKLFAFVQANTAPAIRPVFKGGAANQNLLIGPPVDGQNGPGMAIVSVIDGASANAPLDIRASILSLQSDTLQIDGGADNQNLYVGKIGNNLPGMAIISNGKGFTGNLPLQFIASKFDVLGGPVTFEYPFIENNKLKISDFGGYANGQDETSSWTQAAASNKSRFLTVPSGKHLLSQVNLVGKNLYFEPGATVYNLDGTTDNNSFVGGGYQFARDVNIIDKNMQTMTFSHFHKYRTVAPGYIEAPVNLNTMVHSNNILIYDGRVRNAYDVPAGVHYNAILYGFNAPSSGCATLLNGVLNVGALAQETSGRSEITPISIGLIFLPGYSTQAKANAYFDFVVSGPINEQEAYLGGLTIDSKKRHPGLVQDANHSGSFAIAASTGAGASGFGTVALAGQSTYPHVAMLAISGHAGAPGITTGHDANADYGAKYGIIVGGTEANNVWRAFDSRSKFLFGVLVQDFVAQGITIANAHPGAPANVPGVNSDYDIWAPALLLKGRGGAPATPAAGAILYIDNNGGLHKKNAAGVDVLIAA